MDDALAMRLAEQEARDPDNFRRFRSADSCDSKAVLLEDLAAACPRFGWEGVRGRCDGARWPCGSQERPWSVGPRGKRFSRLCKRLRGSVQSSEGPCHTCHAHDRITYTVAFSLPPSKFGPVRTTDISYHPSGGVFGSHDKGGARGGNTVRMDRC